MKDFGEQLVEMMYENGNILHHKCQLRRNILSVDACLYLVSEIVPSGTWSLIICHDGIEEHVFKIRLESSNVTLAS